MGESGAAGNEGVDGDGVMSGTDSDIVGAGLSDGERACDGGDGARDERDDARDERDEARDDGEGDGEAREGCCDDVALVLGFGLPCSRVLSSSSKSFWNKSGASELRASSSAL